MRGARMQPRTTMRRAWALAAVCAAVGLAGCSRDPDDLRAGRTNVLLIVIDTLRADHLGAWGYPHPTSPVLDALAAEGVRFDQIIANSSWTRPSAASLLTGLYPRTTGVYEEKWDALGQDALLLSERLARNGYLTLGLTSNPNLNAWFGFDQGFDEYLSSDVVWDHMPTGEGEVAHEPGAGDLDDAVVVTDRALSLLDRHAETLRTRPFYLQVVYIDPHSPLVAPRALRRLLAASGSTTAAYDAEIRLVDAEIGRLLEGLEERGLGRDTLVVVTSDHGEGLTDHPGIPFAQAHGTTLYDSELHVPLILWHPALPPGREVRELGALIDLVPTLLDLLGLGETARDLPGRSLAPLATGVGSPPEPAGFVVAETDFREFRKQAIRTPTHKYIRNLDSAAYRREGAFEGRVLRPLVRQALEAYPDTELHDLSRGEAPSDTRTLEARPELADELGGQLEAWEAATPQRPPERRDPADAFTLGDGRVVGGAGEGGQASEPDAAVLEQLRALGYLDEAATPEP